MANKLSDEIKVLYQRTGTSAGRLRSEGERAAFSNNVKADIANVIYQYNIVVKPLLQSLSSLQGMNALDLGLSGNVMFTHITSTKADALAFYDSDLERPRSVKETVDVILSELSRLENLIDGIQDAAEYDDTELRTLIGGNELNLEQLAADTMGASYTLDGDGASNLSYSLSQAVDAMGAFFEGFPGTGNTYPTSYPTLALPTETTLQGAYDLGPASTAGLIALTEEGGEIQLRNELGYGRIFSVAVTGTEDDDLFLVEADEVSIYRVPLTLYSNLTVADGAVGAGQVYTYEDAFGSVITTELMYSDDNGAPTLITRQGRVREYEMGSDFIYAANIIIAGSPPTRATMTQGAAPGSDISYATIDFPGTGNATTAYAYTSPPIDDEGESPTAAKVTLFFTPRTNPGIAAGLTFAIKLDHHDPTPTVSVDDTSVIKSGNSLIPTWDPHVFTTSSTFDIPADMNKLLVIEKTLSLNGLEADRACLIPIKIQRDPAEVGDTYTGDLGLIGMRITWYRAV